MIIVIDVVNHNGYQARTSADQALGEGIAFIAQGFCNLEDLIARFGRDVRMVVQRTRHGGDRSTGCFGDVFDADTIQKISRLQGLLTFKAKADYRRISVKTGLERIPVTFPILYNDF